MTIRELKEHTDGLLKINKSYADDYEFTLDELSSGAICNIFGNNTNNLKFAKNGVRVENGIIHLMYIKGKYTGSPQFAIGPCEQTINCPNSITFSLVDRVIPADTETVVREQEDRGKVSPTISNVDWVEISDENEIFVEYNGSGAKRSCEISVLYHISGIKTNIGSFEVVQQKDGDAVWKLKEICCSEIELTTDKYNLSRSGDTVLITANATMQKRYEKVDLCGRVVEQKTEEEKSDVTSLCLVNVSDVFNFSSVVNRIEAKAQVYNSNERKCSVFVSYNGCISNSIVLTQEAGEKQEDVHELYVDGHKGEDKVTITVPPKAGKYTLTYQSHTLLMVDGEVVDTREDNNVSVYSEGADWCKYKKSWHTVTINYDVNHGETRTLPLTLIAERDWYCINVSFVQEAKSIEKEEYVIGDENDYSTNLKYDDVDNKVMSFTIIKKLYWSDDDVTYEECAGCSNLSICEEDACTNDLSVSSTTCSINGNELLFKLIRRGMDNPVKTVLTKKVCLLNEQEELVSKSKLITVNVSGNNAPTYSYEFTEKGCDNRVITIEWENGETSEKYVSLHSIKHPSLSCFEDKAVPFTYISENEDYSNFRIVNNKKNNTLYIRPNTEKQPKSTIYRLIQEESGLEVLLVCKIKAKAVKKIVEVMVELEDRKGKTAVSQGGFLNIVKNNETIETLRIANGVAFGSNNDVLLARVMLLEAGESYSFCVSGVHLFYDLEEVSDSYSVSEKVTLQNTMEKEQIKIVL